MLPIAPETLLQQRYRILNILEEGSLGRTYLAIDRDRQDAYCAIAELIPSDYPSTVTRAKEFFKQEVTLLYQLQHPQIPRFWTTFEEQNRLFLVRDYTAGKTYGRILEEQRDLGKSLSAAEVTALLLQVLPIIGYVHSKGIIHGDLSPEHLVRRDGDGLPVLIDFGVVREFADKLQATSPSPQLAVGQSDYAPIEQCQTGQLAPHSDLYALAVTAIVLLTGKEPSALFAGDRLNWGWRRWTQIDDGFANVLSRMLSLNPAERYQSAIAVERDLRSLDTPLQSPEQAVPSRPSTIPTAVIGGKHPTPATERVRTAITQHHPKSIWEKPQVFIPLGVLISLLAGLGSWFGVSQLLHRQASDEQVATTPPKQIDFSNPTIPTDSISPSPVTDDLIQPEMNRAIVKEGTVDPNTPIRYRVAALAGQNLDIQLVSGFSQTTDPTKLTSPIAPISPSPATDSSSSNPPISLGTTAATQVLMTILSPTGNAIDDRADRVVTWRGQVPASGDYTIELRPIKGLAGSLFPYKLSITQVAVTASPSPTTSLPAAEGTPPSGVPAPIGGDSINGSSVNPSENNGGTAISPIPIEVPTTRTSPPQTESERPRRRRRRRTQVEPSPQVEERNRAASTAESTPTRRRRRNRVESPAEPTPTRRRNRDLEIQSQPGASPNNDSRDSAPSSAPQPEPSVGIPVPAAKNTTSPERRTEPPPDSGVSDPD
ncbi:protein kinase [Chamaesiphon sp.]|uniref:protein kinase domain-containing protein n=1 Tax=Chamaesiphon sp. TaxID=2814140 RepID=UPI003593F0C8